MEDLKNIIESSVSSIFTKQDVLKLIEEAMERSEELSKSRPDNLISSNSYEALQDRFEDLLSKEQNLVEYETADFHLVDNSIVLQGVDLDVDSIVSLLRDAMDNTLIIEEHFL
jgi:hypothetical protein